MLILGLLLAGILAIASQRLFVYEDPRIDDVEEMLPHANCGACGTAGCRAFAELLVAGEIQPGKCTVNSVDMNQQIAGFLGVDLGQQEKRVARLACAGGSNVAHTHASYTGLDTCRAAALVSGGGKGCVWGCLGFGDCGEVCAFHAIIMDRQQLPVVDADRCTACGDCVDICPRDLFSLQPVSHRLWVACNNPEAGDAAEADCRVLCNGCGRCVADAFQKSDLHQPSPGVVEEDPETQVQSVCDTIKACIEKAAIDPGDVAGIGIDGQMAGILAVGTDGKNVTPYYSWLDTRCAPYITKMQQES